VKLMDLFKKILFSCAAIVLCLVCIAVLGEIVFRFLKGAPAESSLHKITQKCDQTLFEPGIVLESKSDMEGEFEYSAHINTFGYRGKDFSKEKTPGTIRILAMGDSFTFGVGAQDDQTVPFLIEKDLTAQGLAVEVINAGIGHASTIRHWDNLQKIHLQYKPDVVILFFDMTDVWDDWHWERHAVWKDGKIERFDLDFMNGKRSLWMTLAHNSAFCKYLQNKVVRTVEKLRLLGLKNYLKVKSEGGRAKAYIANHPEEFSNEVLTEFDGLLFMRGRKYQDLILPHWARSMKYLNKIKELLDQQGIAFVLATYPHGIYVGPDQWNKGREAWGFKADTLYTDLYPFELMAQYGKEAGVIFIDPLAAFLQAPPQKYFYDWDGHMTPAANRIVADAVSSNPQLLDLLKEKTYAAKQ